MRFQRRGARSGLAILALALFAASALFVRAQVDNSVTARLAAARSTAASSCTFDEASSAQAAFCDTFDHAASTNDTRSGPLNPVVWGVSEIATGGGDHFTSIENPSAGQEDEAAPVDSTSPCGGSSLVPTENLQMCNGALYESVNDDGGQTALAAYPRQPFDISGRTGDVTFNLSNNTQGGHSAWPTFVYTDQPVPAPYAAASGIVTSARNSFGIEFNGDWGDGSGQSLTNGCPYANGVYVGNIFETSNYQVMDAGTTGIAGTINTPFGVWHGDTCLKPSANPSEMSHYEIQLSVDKVVVWGESYGTSQPVEVGELDDANLPLTRGLVWLEDDHYNGDKFNTEQSDTFGWSDFGFDGPVLPRDLGFDVPEAHAMAGAAEQLGFKDGSTVETTGSVTDQNRSSATGALVEFNWFATAETMPTVSLNGGAGITEAWPFGNAKAEGLYGPTYVWRTIAYTVPLTEVGTGSNSITISGSGNGFANVDLILQGAGGVPSCLDPSDCASSVTSTPTPAVSALGAPASSRPAATRPTSTPSSRPTSTPSSRPTSTPASSRPTPEPSRHLHDTPCAIVEHHHLVWGTCSGGTFTPHP